MLEHEMILASAGSGKTYALTTRFLRLLLLGAPPERIVALTFTRKAAGEFSDKILSRLAEAAASPENAAKAAAELRFDEIAGPDTPPADQARFRRILRDVIEALPRLTLGTFDAFFARIIRSFPLELGLGGDFELLDETIESAIRRQALREVLESAGGSDEAARSDFIEAFKRSTFGQETSRLGSKLDEFVTKYHQIFLDAPDPGAWGDPGRIWPGGYPWQPTVDRAEAIAAFHTAAATIPDVEDKHRQRIESICIDAADWAVGAKTPKEVNYLLNNAAKAWPEILAGSATLKIEWKKIHFDGPACQALRALVTCLVAEALERHLTMTAGIHAILRRYEAIYDQRVRRQGTLTFADILRLLTPGHGAPLLRQGRDADDPAEAEARDTRRLMIDWRLDGRFDHWLLDEFQDTSFAQWSALQNLIDEVIQDPSCTRTFFFVGDVKQAIYGWRGGDSRLFGDIARRYNQGAGREVIRTRPLDKSWRSAQPIIDVVNTVFGDAPAMRDLFPAAAAERWTAEWRDHETVRHDLAGHAAWLSPSESEPPETITARLIQAIDPLSRGLTVGVLTRKNKTASTIADHLRREAGIPAVAESDLYICRDNPASAAMLDLFRAAAHPDHSIASRHLSFTPLQNLLEREGLAHPAARTRQLLREVHTEGFEATLERWWERLDACLAPDDAFTRLRGTQMIEAARLFDQTASRDIDAFIEFMENYTLRDTESAGVVRVMTIHKSKGLGFDVVILPELGGNSLAEDPKEITVKRAEDRSVEWVLHLPPKPFRQLDPTLATHAEAVAADKCYEQLALYYVALTRAKQGLYLVTEAPKPRSRSINFPRLLATTLNPEPGELTIGGEPFTCLYSVGDDAWFEHVTPEPPAADTFQPATIPARAARRLTGRLLSKRPSGEESRTIPGRLLFAGRDRAALDHGSAVHAALALVEWWSPENRDAWQAAAAAAGLPPEAVAEALACLEDEQFAAIFRPPAAGRAEVWRERKFEVVIDETWITGVFDRVLIHRDAEGRIAAADIVDFKTDRIDDSDTSWREAAAHYRGQLALYRQAAARLTGLPADKITTAILLTHPIGPDHRHAPPQRLDPA
ncbi:MAG: DNA helicase UvrD [Verrucomicrobia bacterium]|nr:MAG: DNA helicase UvrD [Verrucomicrobiota bacterium]